MLCLLARDSNGKLTSPRLGNAEASAQLTSPGEGDWLRACAGLQHAGGGRPPTRAGVREQTRTTIRMTKARRRRKTSSIAGVTERLAPFPFPFPLPLTPFVLFSLPSTPDVARLAAVGSPGTSLGAGGERSVVWPCSLNSRCICGTHPRAHHTPNHVQRPTEKRPTATTPPDGR